MQQCVHFRDQIATMRSVGTKITTQNMKMASTTFENWVHRQNMFKNS